MAENEIITSQPSIRRMSPTTKWYRNAVLTVVGTFVVQHIAWLIIESVLLLGQTSCANNRYATRCLTDDPASSVSYMHPFVAWTIVGVIILVTYFTSVYSMRTPFGNIKTDNPVLVVFVVLTGLSSLGAVCAIALACMNALTHVQMHL